MKMMYDQDSIETRQRDLINIGLFETDEGLRKISGRDLLSTGEVIDILLDIRQSLDRYYLEPKK